MTDSSTIAYRAGDAVVRVSVEPPTLRDSLRTLFPTVGSPDGPAGIRVRVHDERYEMVSGGTPTPYDSLTELVIALEDAVARALLDAQGQLVRLHAGGARLPGGAALVLGRGEAGKSSLTFAWLRAGHPVYGDDVVLLDGDGCAHAFPRHFKLDPRQFADRGERVEATPFWAPGYDAAWFDPCAGAGWAAPEAVRAVIHLRFQRGAPVTIRETDGKTALSALLHSVMPGGMPKDSAFGCLASLAEQTRRLEVEFGNARDAAEQLEAMLG